MKRFLFAVTLGLAMTPLAVSAQALSPAALVRDDVPTLSVTGEGLISQAPDQASVSLQVVTNNDVATTATTQNNSTFNALRNRLMALGINDAQIRTVALNVNFVPKPTDAAQYRPARTGYVVTRSATIEINDLENVGKVIDAGVASGVTIVSGIAYGIRDTSAVRAKALAAAMRDAQSQASAVAAAGSLRIVGVRRVIVNGGGYSPTPVLRTIARTMSASSPEQVISTEVPASPIETRASIAVIFAIAR